MSILYDKEDKKRIESNIKKFIPVSEINKRWHTILLFIFLILVLIFATFAKPDRESEKGIQFFIYDNKWILTSISILGVFIISFVSMSKEENLDCIRETWSYSKQIIPLLFIGVLVAGFFLGRPGHEGLIPSEYVHKLVGGNSFFSNLFASIIGAFMYFATLTEIPILQGLISSGMGKGPALALLLSGPALSLPNMLVIKSVIGLKKTIAYVTLVIIMSTIAGMTYGTFF